MTQRKIKTHRYISERKVMKKILKSLKFFFTYPFHILRSLGTDSTNINLNYDKHDQQVHIQICKCIVL